MKRKTIFIGLFIVILVGSLLYIYNNKSPLININSFSEYEKVRNSKKSIIYFGYSDCPYCRVFKPFLVEGINKTNTEVYYYDTSKFENTKEFDIVVKDNQIGTVPKLVLIKSGKLINFIDHMSNKKEIIDFLVKASDENED